jgi:hypothetical protein
MRNGRCCRGAACKAEVEVWITPSGEAMPFGVERSDGGAERLIPHFATCPAMVRDG